MSTVLIIDDEASIRKFLIALFKKNGFDAFGAADGNEGIKVFKEKGADLVISDLVMPEKEGLETIKEIKQLRPDIPVIAMSGGGVINPATYLKLAEKFGASHTFTKPVDSRTLVAKVKELLA